MLGVPFSMSGSCVSDTAETSEESKERENERGNLAAVEVGRSWAQVS